MKKGFIGFFAAVLAVILIFAMALTYVIDPLFQYHKPWFGLEPVITNERYQNAGIARNFDFENAAIGNSLAENFYVSDLNLALGGESAKLTSAGSHPLDWKYLLDILSNRENVPRRILFNLDPYIFRGSTTELKHDIPEYLYDSDPFNDVEYLLNFEIFKDYSFDMIKKNRSGNVPDYNSFCVWDDSVQYGKKHIMKNVTRAEISHEEPDVEAYVELALDNIRLLSPYFEAMPETEFLFFCSPFSVLFWDNAERENTFEAYEKCYRSVIGYLLQYGNVTVFLWNDDEMLGVMCDLDYYRDEAHYDSRVCKIMAERIRDGAGIVTKDNCADSLDRLFAFLRSYDYDSIWDEVPDE